MNTAESLKVPGAEFDFSDRDFSIIRDMVLQMTGISLSQEKRQLVYSRFAKRLRALGLNRFDDYLKLVQSADSAEIDNFVSAITTNFTSFFREPHHFEFLAPHVKELLRNRGYARIWSAGCSSGEEPYTIAMSLRNAIPDVGSKDVKILATDLDHNMVAIAQAGLYPIDKINELDPALRSRSFLKGRDTNIGMAMVRPEIRQMITFRQLNLFHHWPFKGPFDVIFCRNVIIYFDKDVQRKLFAGYSAKQRVGDYLIVGHSENLSGVSDDYRLVGRTIYQKVK